MMPQASYYSNLKMVNPNVVTKALTTASGVGQGLSPQQLEQMITDTVLRLSPELALLERKQNPGRTHDFNRKTELPRGFAGQGEMASPTASNSKTVLSTVTLKILRNLSKISNFVIDVSRNYIDAYNYEVENFMQKHVLDLINMLLYGNADAPYYSASTFTTPSAGAGYAFDGLDKLVATNRIQYGTIGGATPVSVKFLDDVIDAVRRKGADKQRIVIGMSPEMLSYFSRLMTSVRLNYGYNQNMEPIELPYGHRGVSYRGVKIIETTSTKPIEKMSPTMAAASGGTTTGFLSDGTYNFRVSPVTYEGEQEASDLFSVTLSGGGSTQFINITMSAPHTNGTFYNAMWYKIYATARNGAAGTEKLIKIVPAYTFDADGAPSDPTTAATFTGMSGYPIVITTLTPGADVPTAMQADYPLVIKNGIRPEVIYLWNLDPVQGLGKVVYANQDGDMMGGLVTLLPLAPIGDYKWFLIKSYCSLVPAYEATSALIRNISVGAS